MTLTIDEIYLVRYGPKLSLPATVQTSIAKLRITPMPYKPVKQFTRHTYRNRHHNNSSSSSASSSDNWREKALVDIVRKVREKDDIEYSQIISIFNKVSPGNVEKLSGDAIEVMQKRDEEFRLRVSALLFNRSITEPTVSVIMADCAHRISKIIPGIAEDIQAQIEMFPKLYDMSETIVIDIATITDPQDERLVQWTKQKDKRRAYARFMLELYVKELINELVVKQSLEQIVTDFNETAKQVKSTFTESNVTQLVEFMFEASKKLKSELKEYLKVNIEEVLKVPREELKVKFPSMNMKTKFALEDALKELNKKE